MTQTAQEAGISFPLLQAVHEVNNKQKQSLLPKIQTLVGDIKGKTIAVLGLSFKPKTDDIRDAPSVTIIQQLLNAGAKVNAYDPIAMQPMKKYFPTIEYTESAYDAAKDAECIVIATEWDEFRYLDLSKIKQSMKTPVIVDGRNIYDEEEVKRMGFKYVGVGRGNSEDAQ